MARHRAVGGLAPRVMDQPTFRLVQGLGRIDVEPRPFGDVDGLHSSVPCQFTQSIGKSVPAGVGGFFESLEKAGCAEHDAGVRRIPLRKALPDLFDTAIGDPYPGGVVRIENAGLVTVHGEAHLAGCRRIAGERPSDPRIEKMIRHDEKEGCLAGLALGTKRASAVAQSPVLRLSEIDRHAATPSDLGKMRLNGIGLVAKGNDEASDVHGLVQRADDSLAKRQAEHLRQGFWQIRVRGKP